MAFEITKQEIIKQAIALNTLWKQTRDQKYRDEELRLRRIAIDLENVTIGGGSQNLQEVTDVGNVTTNTIDTAGTKSDYFLLDTTATPTLQPGMIGWNDAFGTADLRLKGDNVTLQVGQEIIARVVNKTGADLLESEYKVVRVRIASEGGAQGQRLAVVLAQGDNDPDSVTTLGIVTETILDNQEGFITILGNVSDIDTTGTLQGETWVDGDVLYLSPTTPGGLTKVPPVSPQHTVTMGYVVYAHQNQGKIFVKVDNGYEIDELHNVLITNPQEGDVLNYDSANGVWVNGPSSLGAVDPNEGLEINGTSLGTVYNTTVADGVNSVAVGGATAQPASFWKSKSLVQVLDTILFPTILPSILTNKSVSLTISGTSGTLEIGQTILRTLTASFNQGLIKNGDGTTNPNPLVGLATQYTFTGTGISSTAQAGNTLEVSNTIVSGSNNWAVTVNHDAGTGLYYDNKGNVENNLDASRVAGTTTDSSSSPSVTGIYPYFYLKSSSPISSASMASAIAAGTATKVVGSSTGTLAIPYNMSGQYLAVAYPASSTTKTVYYVTALDNGAITVVFNAVASELVNSPQGYWSGVSYSIHTSKAAITNSNPTIELRNS